MPPSKSKNPENCSDSENCLTPHKSEGNEEWVAPTQSPSSTPSTSSIEPFSSSLTDAPNNLTNSAAPRASSAEQNQDHAATSLPLEQSWVFRMCGSLTQFFSRLFGIGSIIFLLAVAANIPILQFLSFGYLLEVSGRLARKQKFSDAMIGLKKASVLGGLVLGTWLMLWPIRFASGIWYDAYLIDPSSQQTLFMRVLQILLIALVVFHISAAWLCGGKLRYFFWPIVAPFSFTIWLARRLAGARLFRRILSVVVGWISPRLVEDICNVKPVVDWFLPAIVWRRIRRGHLYADSRDRVWDFATSLNLGYYFILGFKGFLGTFLWLLLPTSLLVVASFSEGGVAILSGILGVVFAIPIFIILPFTQAHFAKDGKLKRFLEIRAVFKNYGHAPWAHLTALVLTLVLALPLFFLKIEEIPPELLWSLSVVFVMFSWPARLSVGWAYRRGSKRDCPSRWWVRYPIVLLCAPIALSFALILTLTRYISWYGAMSLFENHVFLLPAPFWL